MNSASMVMLIGLGAALVVGLFLAFFITRSVTKPVNRIIESLDAGSSQVASAADPAAASSRQLTEGASEQAASPEETSSSMDKIAESGGEIGKPDQPAGAERGRGR